MTFLGWYQVKLFIEHASGISMDAWHILIGFILFLLFTIALRRGIAHPLPWLAVMLLTFGNEAYDLHVELWPDIGSQLGEGFKDILLTIALPTLIMLAARWRPSLLATDTARQPLADDQVTDRAEVLVAGSASPGLENKRQ